MGAGCGMDDRTLLLRCARTDRTTAATNRLEIAMIATVIATGMPLLLDACPSPTLLVAVVPLCLPVPVVVFAAKPIVA